MEANASFEFQSLLKPIRTGRQDPTKDHGELGDPLSPMGRLFHRPGSSIYIMGLLGSKTTIDPSHFKAGVASAFLAYPRFTSLLVADKKGSFSGDGSAKMRWVKTEVDIDQHVFFPKIEPKDTSNVGVDKFVEEYTRDLTGIPLDMSKPLWDVHVLNLDKMTTQGAMAVALFRFHHCIGDGMSLMSLFMSFTRKASDPTAKPSLPVFSRKKQQMDPASKRGRCLSFLRVLWNTLVDIFYLLATAFFLDDTPNPLKGPKDARQSPRRIILKSVRMEDIKFVKHITKTTVNDVVMGVVEAGVSRYLNRRYGEINQGGNKVKNSIGNLPQKLRFRATIYFNIRAVQGIQAVENMINKDSQAR
uniref:diacylglycerol O-acyltransferase n=1 Tax=Kalanchoe fedtschenkoi TaxID=63787 RepID=A0A7N0SZA0_KALFE